MYSYSNFTINQPIAHHHLAVCSSTNSELMQSVNTAKIDPSQPYMLTAGMQTAGRGQRARTWQSPIGNIYLSLYHPLQVPLSGLLSLVVGFHLTRLPIIQQINRQRRAVGLPSVGVKWANDIGYYDVRPSSQPPTQPADQFITQSADQVSPQSSRTQRSSFNKLAGILIEPVLTDNQITGVIVGVGINIEAAPLLSETTKEGMDYQAISLTQIIKETQLAHNRQGNKNHINTGLNNTAVAFPRADDLYRPVSATILRAINQFMTFKQDPYSLTEFIKDYSAVNVLAGHQVQITQQSLIATKQAGGDTASQVFEPQILEGKVTGINADGSLQLQSNNEVGMINVYTGTIRVI